MPRAADLGTKRLASLAPDAWAQWLTDDDGVTVRNILAEEFQWLERASDVVIQAHSPACGDFVIVNEVQLRYTKRVPRRIFAYAGLASERCDLPAYPVLMVILPPGPDTDVADQYDAEVLGLRGHQDYRVIKLWEVDAELPFRRHIPALLPFVPVMRGGDSEAMVTRAAAELGADEKLVELEALLGFLATFVLGSDVVQRIMRWDMSVVVESPLYQQILREGERRGTLQRARDDVLGVLRARFSRVPANVERRLARIDDVDRLTELNTLAATTPTVAEFVQRMGD